MAGPAPIYCPTFSEEFLEQARGAGVAARPARSVLRTYEMICFYFTGLADEDELMAHIEKLKSQDA